MHPLARIEETLDLADTVEGARERVRELVPHIDDTRFDEQWAHISQAERWVRGFEDDPWLALDEDPVGNSLVDSDDYKAINGADRAGENDYAGLDYEQMGSDLAEQWRLRRRSLIGELVGEHD